MQKTNSPRGEGNIMFYAIKVPHQMPAKLFVFDNEDDFCEHVLNDSKNHEIAKQYDVVVEFENGELFTCMSVFAHDMHHVYFLHSEEELIEFFESLTPTTHKYSEIRTQIFQRRKV